MENSVADIVKVCHRLEQELEAASKRGDLNQAIADGPFSFKLEMALLFLGFICLFLVDEAGQAVRLISFSDTEEYRLAVQGFEFDPMKYRVPFSDTQNTIIKAILSGQPSNTIDWGTLSRKQTPEEIARLNQANSGIADSIVYPLTGKRRGALMYNYFQYQEDIGEQQMQFMAAYTKLVSAMLDTSD